MKSINCILKLLIFILLHFGFTGQAAAGPLTIVNEGPEAASTDSLRESSDNIVSVESDLVERAIQAYREMEYAKSIELFENAVKDAVENDYVSSQLYYNLANAYFRDNQLAKAILNFERALLLDPGDGDIRHNLRFVNNHVVDRITPAGYPFIANWFNSLLNLFSSNAWANMAILFFLLFLLSIGLYLFVKILWARKSGFYLGILFFTLMIAANIFSFSQKRKRINRDYAIVMVGAAQVNASPDINSNMLFELHEGTKVKIRNSDADWQEIEIVNGSVGWTSKDNLEAI